MDINKVVSYTFFHHSWLCLNSKSNFPQEWHKDQEAKLVLVVLCFFLLINFPFLYIFFPTISSMLLC